MFFKTNADPFSLPCKSCIFAFAMRYFLQFSYLGKNYFGYQVQPRQISVQQVLEEKLSLLLGQKISITAAGRTDTGVHAKKIYAHFDVDVALPEDLAKRLNAFLPYDIAVQNIFPTAADLHARFDAVSRTYEYCISLEKSPFLHELCWEMPGKSLDVEKMNAAAKIISGYEDFSSFAKSGAAHQTPFCKILEIGWAQQAQLLVFRVSANRFLRNMVRAMVGTMVEVGQGKLQPEDLHAILAGKNRSLAGSSVPAKGLSLVDVRYKNF